MRINKKNINIIISIIIALLYAFLLMQIPEFVFRDRDNYLIYADRPDNIFNLNLEIGLIYTIFNEPLFLLINYLLGLFIDPLVIPSLFAFFTSSVLAFFLLRESHNFFLKIMALLYTFFVPVLFHLQLVTLRQGLAISILLIVMMINKKRSVRIVASIILGFIHSSFFIISFLLILEFFVRNKKYKLKVFIYILVSIIMASSILLLGSMLGVRQTELYETVIPESTSGLSFLLYCSVLFLILFRGDNYLNTYQYNSIALLGLATYVSLYFISPFVGRLLASFLPFIFVSLFKTKNFISYMYILIFLLLNMMIFKQTIINNSLMEYVSF